MRISDWSSDVCSSDLDRLFRSLIQSGRLEVTWPDGKRSVYQGKEPGDRHSAVRITDKRTSWAILRNPSLGAGEAFMGGRIVFEDGDIRQDRKSVVQGKSVSVRVDLGGRRIVKKKKE